MKYALFVSFFPHIIQGPIARYDRLAHQLYEGHCFDYKNVKFGVQLALYGFFKKVVIADRAALFVNSVFNNAEPQSGSMILLAALFYAVQIYTDFSGCVDICRGASQALGISLDKNFDHPYFAVSIADFWRRWHISLSSWLRDYLYIPLGGNRKGTVRKYVNVVVVFLVSGVWHGVGAHYIVWGLLHGIYQVAGFVLAPVKRRLTGLMRVNTEAVSYRVGQSLVTFGLVSFAWLFFRLGLRQAVSVIGQMFSNFNSADLFTDALYTHGLDFRNMSVLLAAIAAVLVISLMQERFSVREKLAEQNLWFRWTVYAAALMAVLVLGIYGPGYSASQFIYMQF